MVLCFWSGKSHPLDLSAWKKSYPGAYFVSASRCLWCRAGDMDADSCLSFSTQSNRRTPDTSPSLEHGSGPGTFLHCDELKAPHLGPVPHRLYATALADFTHGAAQAPAPGSPGKHSKFLESLSQDHKGTVISGKPGFYDSNSDGKWQVQAQEQKLLKVLKVLTGNRLFIQWLDKII